MSMDPKEAAAVLDAGVKLAIPNATVRERERVIELIILVTVTTLNATVERCAQVADEEHARHVAAKIRRLKDGGSDTP